MRRMYTTQGIQKLIDDSIDDAFENIENQEIGKGLFEKIKDKDGHLRFIDGDGTPLSLSGVSTTYCKWSLSGTHLMLVVAFYVEDGVTIPQYAQIGQYNLPEWILNKIVSAQGQSQGNIEVKRIEGVKNDAFPFSTPQIIPTYIQKNQYGQIVTSLSEAYKNETGSNVYFRAQYDLIIDDSE